MQNEPKPDLFDILLRVGGFVLVGFLAYVVASANGLEDVSRSAVAVFVAGLAANIFAVRKFEQGRPTDFGLGWPPRHLAAGFALGAAALGALVVGTLLADLAMFASVTAERSVVPLTLFLFFGAVGEEMLFRGYAFQYLARAWNPTLTVLGSGILFGLLHLSNNNVQPVAVANTILWGFLLGYAYLRTRTLWFPSGIHFGWNLASTLFTSNLSGTTIRATGWDLQWSASELWSGGSYGVEGGLLVTIVALPVFFLVRRVR